jgi:hypothetical protein
MMAKGIPPEIERKLRAEIERMAGLLFQYAAEAQCARLDMVELQALCSEEPGPEFDIAESAIARAKMRGIE